MPFSRFLLAAPIVGALLVTVPIASADSGCVESTDAQIHALIDSLRTAGAAITIDGDDSDWALFPSFSDPSDDLVANPGQEIVAGSIAPLSDRIKLLVRTAGTPPQTAGAFIVALDLLNGPPLEMQILLTPPTGPHTVILFDAENQPILPPAGAISGTDLEIGFGADFIEVEIPYSVLTPFLPDLALPDQRSWVRGGIGSFDSGAIIDYGPGASSYRLIPTPYDLDPPLPANPNAPRSLRLPLQGQWFVTQGAFGELSHQTYWAYDFTRVDSSFNRSEPPDSTSNADYYSFGAPILAPAPGTVTQAVGTNPDVPPLVLQSAPYNIVALDVGSGLTVSLLHEKQNSLAVNTSDVVVEGQLLGEVGNSGYSTAPHLHVEINESGAPLGASVRGVELEHVRVSLNPVADDPWQRECSAWEVRGGFLVESLPVFEPKLVGMPQAKLIASDGAASENFGYKVGLSGDVGVVGALNAQVGSNPAQGKAYVLRRDGSSWAEEQILTASDGGANDSFGFAADVFGDVAAVAAVGHNGSQGAVYVFRFNGTSWTQEQKLTASDGAASDLFGVSVRVLEDVVLVGAAQNDVGGNASQGAAYVFRFNGTSWVEEQKLTASDGAAGDRFGIGVDLALDRVAIGADRDDISGNSNQGSAYVFEFDGSVWTETAKLVASDGAASDGFGTPVLWGDFLFASAQLADVDGNANQGASYVFQFNGSSWVEQQKLTASDGGAGEGFGGAAVGEDVAVIAGGGGAYVFRFDGTSWLEDSKFLAPESEAGGHVLGGGSISGTRVLLGASNLDVGANTDQGAAYVFDLAEETKLFALDGAADDGFGVSVSVSGNVALVGAVSDDIESNADQGSAHILRWNGSSWVSEQKVTASDGAAYDSFGVGVSAAADVALIGAPGDEIGGNSAQGSAYIFRKNGSSWVEEQKLIASDGAMDDYLGYSVSVSGDVALVGAYLDDVGTNQGQGSSYIFRWNGSSWVQEQKLTASDGAPNDFFGYSVSVSGDVALVGAYGDAISGNPKQGSAYVFRWNGSSWVEEQRLIASDGGAYDYFGQTVSVSGDVALIGAYFDAIGSNSDQGSAYVFRWTGSSWVEEQKLTASDGAIGDHFGIRVATSGDVALVGAHADDIGSGSNQGSAYVFRWNGSSWVEERKLSASDGATGDLLGTSVSVSGDVALVGAPEVDLGASNQGAAYAYLLSPEVRILLEHTALGGTATVVVNGVEVTIATLDGQSAATVAANLAAAIETNPLVADQGISAHSVGDEVVVLGAQAGDVSFSTTDPGLDPPPVPVPALSPLGLGALLALLAAGGAAAARRRGACT